MEDNTIYADYELEGDGMFVVTPEGNYFSFPFPEYDEHHEPVEIIDTESHVKYRVVFDE